MERFCPYSLFPRLNVVTIFLPNRVDAQTIEDAFNLFSLQWTCTMSGLIVMVAYRVKHQYGIWNMKV